MNLSPTGVTNYIYSWTIGTINVNGDRVTGYSLRGLDNMSAPVLLGLFNDNLTVSITSTPLAGDSYTHYNLTDSRRQ